MATSIPTLLLTSSVYVFAPFVELADSEKRINLTLESIERWLEITGYINIVICDGSGYNFSQDMRNRFPSHKIECIFFKNDFELVATQGKGYGEGQIINYALENSEYLRNVDYFVKCTSKLWVLNFCILLMHWNNIFQCEVVYANKNSVRMVKPIYIDTRFYITNKKFYTDHLGDAYKHVNDHNGYYLERSFKDSLLRQKFALSQFLFRYPPSIEGISGSTGEVYKTSTLNKILLFKRIIRRIIIKTNELLGSFRTL